MAVFQYEIGNQRNYVYLIESEGHAFVVDPQKDMDLWEADLEKLGAKLEGILLTHTHWDHVLGLATTVRKYMVPIFVHEKEVHRLGKEPQPVHDHLQVLGESLDLGSLKIHVIHAPGHSSGEVCFLIKNESAPWEILTGDAVFVGTVGRTDLPTGSTAIMLETLKMLRELPDDTVIYPGHNYGRTATSTIGEEKKTECWNVKSVEEFDALP